MEHVSEGPSGISRPGAGPHLLETLAAAAVLLILVAVFLREPIRRYSDSIFTSADYLQQFSITRVPDSGEPRNFLMGDAIQQYVPWALFNRAELARGHIPLWNPYNGCGTPHLAAYQTAVFSPFSVPLYVLPLKAALIAAACLRLMALGLFTFLFLRRLGLIWTAALAGGVLYAFAGYHVIWLSGPESGASAAVPASLFFAETALQRLERRAPRKRLAGPLAGLTLSLAIGLFAGHPETFLVGLILLSAFILFRLAEGGASPRAERFRRMAPPLIVAGLLAAGLAAVQIVPFLEYLARSSVGLARAEIRPRGFVLRDLPLQIFPYLLGGPPGLHNYSHIPGHTTFNEEVSGFMGPFALLLFGAGAILGRKDRRMRFFLFVSAVWFLWAYDVPVASTLLDFIPPLGAIADGRSATIWILCVSAVAAFGVDALHRLPRSSLSRALAGLAGGAAAIAAAGSGGAWLLFRHLGTTNARGASLCREAFRPQLTHASLALGTGLAALALVLLSPGKVARRLAGVLLAATAYLQGGEVLSGYNPTVPSNLLYARTPAIRALQKLPPHSRLVIVSRDNIPADANMGFGLTLASNYDGLWVSRYDRLYVGEFFGGAWIRNAGGFSKRAMDLFGVEGAVVPNQFLKIVDPGNLEKTAISANQTYFPNRGGPGRYWVAARAIPAESEEASLKVVWFGNFDPRVDVVIEGDLDLAASVTDLNRPVRPGTVRVTLEEPEHVKLDVSTENRGVVVATIAFYPGWRALVDRRPAPIYPANAAFLGIPVAAGRHEVDLRYDPLSWKLGVAVTLASLIGGLALVTWAARSRGGARA